MYLIYTDETGTNNQTEFCMYGGLVVHETKINNLELQLEQIVAKFLNIENMLDAELHTSELFNYLVNGREPGDKNKKIKFEETKSKIKDKNINDFAEFINELIQFLVKMDIPLIVSVIDKKHQFHKTHQISAEVSQNAYSFKFFLNMVDRYLATKQEMGLLIADSFADQLCSKDKSKTIFERISSNELIKKSKETTYLRVLYESMMWKMKATNSNHCLKNSIAPMKYIFESRNMYIFDNINFTASQDSIINQIADTMLFVLRKSFEVKTYNDELKNRDDIKKIINFCECIMSNIDYMGGAEKLKCGILSSDKVADIFLYEGIETNFVDNLYSEMQFIRGKAPRP